MAVPVPYGKQRQGHHLEVEMAFIEVRGMTSRRQSLYRPRADEGAVHDRDS
jgi:hypothetical protein